LENKDFAGFGQQKISLGFWEKPGGRFSKNRWFTLQGGKQQFGFSFGISFFGATLVFQRFPKEVTDSLKTFFCPKNSRGLN